MDIHPQEKSSRPATVTAAGLSCSKIALLPDDQIFTVNAKSRIGYDDEVWADVYVEANVAVVVDGVLTFYWVDQEDGLVPIYYTVASFPAGWYGVWRPIETPAVVAVEEPVSEPEPQPEPEPVSEDLQPVTLDDGTVVKPHKKLKEIWEGQGDPDDDPSKDELLWWEARATMDDEEYDEWMKAGEEEEEAREKEMREQSDDARDVLAKLPAHLNPLVPNLTQAMSGNWDEKTGRWVSPPNEQVEDYHGKATGSL